MRIEHVQIRRVSPGEDCAAWVRALEDPGWLNAALVLKEGADPVRSGRPGEQGYPADHRLGETACPWVRRGTLLGRDVVVKCRPAGSFAERLKLGVQHGRGDRHWKGACWLTRNGFRTAAPYVLATAELDGAPVELLAMEALAGRNLLEHLAAGDLGVGEQHAVAAAVGRMLIRLSKLQHYNRDSKPSNLMVVRTEAGPEIAIIDCVAIRPRAYAEQMLASLVIEPIDQGCPPRRAVMMRVLHAAVDELRQDGGPPLDRDAARAVVRELWLATSARVDHHFRTRAI